MGGFSSCGCRRISVSQDEVREIISENELNMPLELSL